MTTNKVPTEQATTVSLVKVTCELKYQESMPLLEGHARVFEQLTGQKPEETGNRWLVPGLRVDAKDRKEVVVIDPQRTIVDLQEPPSVQHAEDVILQRFELVQQTFGIPDVSRWGCRTVWIQPHDGTRSDLQQLFKERVFRELGLVRDAEDMAFISEFRGEPGGKITVTCGPMWAEQLRERYVRWGTREYPPAFVCVDVDFASWSQPAYSRARLGKFLGQAFAAGAEHARAAADTILGDKR